MLNKKLKSASLLISAMFLISACGTQMDTGMNPTTNTTNGSNTNTTVTSEPSNLKFNKVLDTKVAQYNGMLGANANNSGNKVAPGATAEAAAPMVAGAGAAMSSDAARAPYMSYFPGIGPFEEYTVIDFEEAKTAGFSGTYLDVLNKIVKPVVKGLGNDSRMVSSNGSSDTSGINKANDTIAGTAEIMPYPNPYQQYQWQFTYVSSAKKEVYSIFVSSAETLVLRQKWGIKDLTPDEIKIDSNAAIKTVTTAILNKSFVSPDNQPNYASPESETLYEIPANSSWYLYLEKEKGKLIWNINMNVNYNYLTVPTPAYDPSSTTKPAMPAQPEYWYSGGYARVDAATGAILSLVRPTRYKNTYPVYPMPMAVDTPASSGSASDTTSASISTENT